MVKVVLVVSLLRNKLWAYPWLIVVLLAFISYQLYRILLAPSPGLIALTIFDTIITALTWREWRIQRQPPDLPELPVRSRRTHEAAEPAQAPAPRARREPVRIEHPSTRACDPESGGGQRGHG